MASLSMDAQKPPVFFSVIGGQNGSTTIDPMFLVQHGQIFPIPDPCSDTNPASIHFFKTFLSPGSKYHFIFGGTTAGTISVLRNTNDGDFPAKLNSTIKLQNLQMGLATNSEDFSRIGTERRSPTQSEVNLTLRIAGKLFREHGVSWRGRQAHACGPGDYCQNERLESYPDNCYGNNPAKGRHGITGQFVFCEWDKS
jgi:hypothetical protein